MQSPPLKFRSYSWALEGHTIGAQPQTGTTEYAGTRGARWTFTGEIVPMSLADARAVRAWIHSLRGQAATGDAILPTGYRNPAFDTLTGDELARFDDGSGETFDDGTTFDDYVFQYAFTATAAAGATSVTAVGDVSALQAGDMLLVQGDRPQIVKCVSVASQTVEFVPALRRAVSATSFAFGQLSFPVRMLGETPKVPFMSARSEAFQIQFVEPY
jgi:hypothetical protein